MSKSDGPKLVAALFSFKGKNNDELCFKKGDIITITQLDDGGWWEGTLNEKTGWFPSNYVKEYRAPGTPLKSFSFSDSDSASTSTKVSPEKSSPDSPIHLTMNRDIVLKDIVDSERANVGELQGLVSNFLQPLETANILKKEEYKQLIGNIHEVLEAHQRLLANLDSALSQGLEARVGNIFLTLASKLKSIHTTYCNCHPQAVCILDRFRDELNEFMERSGAISPGILVLTTGLSKPFRRLDKYSAMLQELERHTEKNHPDRGDTQRSVSVYRDIAERCAAIRKQRELALQILTSGVKGWEGEELNVLGDIIHVGPVIVASGVERRDRYFVLFPTTLLVLSTSARMSSFVYEGKLPLTGITAVALEQSEEIRNAFEISGPMIESITVLCPSREERQHWIELLSQEQIASRSANLSRSPTSISHKMHPETSRKKPDDLLEFRKNLHTQEPMNIIERSSHKSSSQNSKLQAAGAEQHSSSPGIKTPWGLASLRPAPPIYALKTFGKPDAVDSCRSTKTCNERQFEDDAIILRVIEGYCLSANARFTVHSAMLDFDPLHKVNDRASFMHSRVGNWDAYEDRCLSETVKALKNQMTDLQLQVAQLCKQLEEERKSRLSLAATVKRSMAVIDGTVP